MNSKELHKYEKIMYQLIGSFLITFCIVLIGQMTGIVNPIFFSIVLLLILFLIIVIQCIIKVKTKDWLKQGRELSSKLDLQYLIILPSNLLSSSSIVQYEVHLKPFTIKNGFIKRKQSLFKVKEEMYEGLKEDFKKIYSWVDTEKISGLVFHTTTHDSLANIWNKTSSQYFYMKEYNEILDPFAKMNKFQYFFAAFCLTGRFRLDNPGKHQWKSYFFYISRGRDKQ